MSAGHEFHEFAQIEKCVFVKIRVIRVFSLLLAEKHPFFRVGKIFFSLPQKHHFFEKQQTRINIGPIG